MPAPKTAAELGARRSAAEVLELAKRYKQESISLPCCAGGRSLVIGQASSGGACGARVSVDTTYYHQCAKCLRTRTSSVTYDDDDF